MSRRIWHTAKILWLNVGIALLVLVLIEGAARAGFALLERGRHDRDLEGVRLGVGLESPADESWFEEYLQELGEALQGEWHPYLYWRTKPYHGKYVNVDEAGIRRTWNGTPSPSSGQLRVFMFGGSMLWGQGARDEFTIPSLVSKKLTRQLASGAWVVNLAENGYVSTQEVIALMLELRNGNVPDVVVFLDGVNDPFAAFQTGVAGVPQNENHRVAEFNALRRFSVRQVVVDRLALYRLAAAAARSVGLAPSARGPGTNIVLTDALASDVVDVYLRNVSVVEGLAAQFGFRAVFFWQPNVFTKKRLSQGERQWYMRSGTRPFGRPGPSLRKVYEAFGARMSAHRIDHVYDLSGVFDEVSATIYIDEFHVVEAGNEKIAEAIVQTLLRDVVRVNP